MICWVGFCAKLWDRVFTKPHQVISSDPGDPWPLWLRERSDSASARPPGSLCHVSGCRLSNKPSRGDISRWVLHPAAWLRSPVLSRPGHKDLCGTEPSSRSNCAKDRRQGCRWRRKRPFIPALTPVAVSRRGRRTPVELAEGGYAVRARPPRSAHGSVWHSLRVAALVGWRQP